MLMASSRLLALALLGGWIVAEPPTATRTPGMDVLAWRAASVTPS
ncbi:hypothetical protein A176_003681 [Myxococcus hansupus]|uniref:Uncharacterized protein n=1 Tax=Pseudomyxococcus hansupus TaxID=1297742 RepID=A0A0H4WVB9_9BACT|nr:hypothetical protein A176_003681 [Myxococcus hansupus]